MNDKVSCRGAPRRLQRGIALLAFSVLLAIVSVGLLVERLSSRSQGNTARERSSNEVLAKAKSDLIAWSVSHPTEPGRLPWPDRNGDGNYDGGSDCVTTGFANTHLLGRFPYAGDAAPCDVVPFGSFTVDGYGEPLWYAVSRNLLWNRGQSGTDPPLNPGLLDGGASYPWLTVRDESGNVLSNRVAAVIIAPGGVVGNQARGGAAPNPDQYLDNAMVGATSYDNSDADLDFIMYPDSRKTVTDSDSFNDQLIYITIDELMRPVEKRALGDAAVALQTYRTNRGRYPWLSPYRDPKISTAGDTMTGRVDSVSGGDHIIDADGNFPPSGLDDHIIVNVTRRTVWEIKDQHDPDDLHIKGSPDFQPGDAYNIRPAFNGVWGGLDGLGGDGREGHVPYIDLSAAESYAVSTGFNLSWNNGTTGTPPTCGPLEAWLLFSATGCSQVQNSYQSGTFTQPTPPVPVTGAAAGECIWTDIDTVDCFCHTADCNRNIETRNNAYTVNLLCFVVCGGVLTILDVPVTRIYTYTFDYTGDGSKTSVGNVKTRRVANTNPETIGMVDQITVLGVNYTIWTGAVSVPAGSYVMDGIYFDIEDNIEFPVYFFTNLWHHYIYAKIAADHVAINTVTGNPSTDSCTPGTDCIELEIGGATVRDDIQAALVSAGGELWGQDRTDGDMRDYFEDENEDEENDTVEHAVAASGFNDQVRIIRPNSP